MTEIIDGLKGCKENIEEISHVRQKTMITYLEKKKITIHSSGAEIAIFNGFLIPILGIPLAHGNNLNKRK